MALTLADRVSYVTGKLRELSFHNITLTAYKPGVTGQDGYYKLLAVKSEYRVFVAELLVGGKIAKYSYTLLHGERPVLRYDNAPHHPNIETFPHHKHENDEVKPLHDNSIEAFLKEVRRFIEK